MGGHRGEDWSGRCNTGGSNVRKERPPTDTADKRLANVGCGLLLFLGTLLGVLELCRIFSHGNLSSGIKNGRRSGIRCQTNCLQSEGRMQAPGGLTFTSSMLFLGLSLQRQNLRVFSQLGMFPWRWRKFRFNAKR